MLQIILPVALILCTIRVGINSVTVCLIVTPLALILVAVHVPERPLTMCLVIPPVAFVSGAILPDLFAPAVSVLALPLPSVFRTIFENVLWPLFNAFKIIDVCVLAVSN